MLEDDLQSYLPALETAIERFPLKVATNTPLLEALALMSQVGDSNGNNVSSSSIEKKYSCALVVEDSQLLGILTERDVVALAAENRDLKQLTIGEVMRTNVPTLTLESNRQDISSALFTIDRHRIKHLVVVDTEGKLKGIITPESIRKVLTMTNLLKLRRIEEVMTNQVVQAPPNASVLSLSKLMIQYRVSCIVITQSSDRQETDRRSRLSSLSGLVRFSTKLFPVGIITERDIVKFKVMGLDLSSTQAQSVMSAPLFCLTPLDSLWRGQQEMERLRVRRLVIAGSQGELQGILTQMNILQALESKETHELIKILQQELQTKTNQLKETNQKLQQEITERLEIEKALFKEKELAEITLQSIADAVVTTDSKGKVQYLNPVAQRLTGWQQQEAKDRLLSEVFNIVEEFTRETLENPVAKVLREDCVLGLTNHTLLISRDGREYPIDDSAAPIRDRQGNLIGAVMVFHDISESRQLQRQLSWQATHDSLTRLYNRLHFERELIEAIASSRGAIQQHVLCYLDLDQFKIVNDVCGHVAGDELLRQITALLQKRVRSTDILARLGGDEFGLLLYRCSIEQAQALAESLRQLIQDFRFSWEEKNFSVGVSIGLVSIDHNIQDATSALSAADAACCFAKDKGRNSIYVYRSDDWDIARERGQRQWILKLEHALEENSFCLYFQKILPISKNAYIKHYEVLLRLIDEKGKVITPGVFLPAAERYNLMPAIDRWVIANFFARYEVYCNRISTKAPQSERIYTINLSGASINSDRFLSFLSEQFAQHQIPPQNICFEITETVAISNLNKTAEFIRKLKELGCKFALDDFGSGMSSLAYLQNLPVDYLKIDGSFVKKIARHRVDFTIVECFNNLSHVLGIETIAEFVENDAILEKIKHIGVDYAQGFGIAKPIPLDFVE